MAIPGIEIPTFTDSVLAAVLGVVLCGIPAAARVWLKRNPRPIPEPRIRLIIALEGPALVNVLLCLSVRWFFYKRRSEPPD